MPIKVASSEKENITEIVNDIKAQFKDISPKIILFFSSSKFSPSEISAEMTSGFSECEVFGCTTAGEIISGQMKKNSVVAMACDSEIVKDVKVNVIENLKESNDINEAFKTFEDYYQTKAIEMDFKKYVGLVLIDGLSISEEKLMDKLGDITNVTFIGGSAGDDLKFTNTYVFANGKSYSNAAVLVLLEVNKEFDIIKTQSFDILDRKLVATKVDEENRIVHEFNNKPAVIAYAEAIDKPVEEVDKYFMKHPVGLIIEGQAFVRSPMAVKGDSLAFYCNIKNGAELSVLESGNMIKDTDEAIKNKEKEIGSISGIINFHCILRTLDLESKGLTEQYGQLFSNIPTIGFSTYGEEYIGHVNQTSTMLVFK